MNKSTNQSVILLCFLLFSCLTNQSQNLNLTTVPEKVEVDYSGSNPDYVHDFKIPTSLGVYDHIEFYIRGGDGGRRIVPDLCRVKGGGGASVTVQFKIGTGPGELHPGGKIRFVLGEHGENDRSNGIRGAGGGGGTAILYKEPGATTHCSTYPSLKLSNADSCWVLLAVAGGGGGAYSSGVCGGQAGKNGRASTSGSDGYSNNFSGGVNGSAGGNYIYDGFEYSGGGGGYRGQRAETIGGRRGGFSGGNGGQTRRNGGFGYGGGGMGATGGGGGGGFSGGGGGNEYSAGGGGGSFANSRATYSSKVGGTKDGSPDPGFATYRFQDVTPTQPVARCKDITLQLDASGTVTINAADSDNGSYDPSGATLDFCYFALTSCPSTITRNCGRQGDNTFYLVASNSSGAADFCTSIVTIEDNLAPTANCRSSSLTVALDASGQASITSSQIDAGSLDNCGIYSDSLSKTDFACTDQGIHTVTLYVSDRSGNSDQCTATVNIVDNTPPTAVCNDVTLNLSSFITSVSHQDLTQGSSDNCGLRLNTATYSFGCQDIGTQSLNLTVRENFGNKTASCTANITVNDIQAPTAVCNNVTLNLGSFLTSVDHSTLTAGSYDNCGLQPNTATYTFGCANIGQNTLNLTVRESTGNKSASCTSVVTVVDVAPPSAFCQPATVLLDAGGNGTLAASQVDNGSFDNCGIVSRDLSKTVVSCADVGAAQSISLTVSDVSGNTASCSTAITTKDEHSPTISCPAPINRNNDVGVCGAVVSYSVSTSDNCPGESWQLTTGQPSGSTFPVGTTTNSITVTDAAGNTASCSFNVTITDNEAPTISCPANMNQRNDPDVCGFKIKYNINTSDNCSGESWQLTAGMPSSSTFPIGTTTNSITVTDAAGNSASCSFTITVIDTEQPGDFWVPQSSGTSRSLFEIWGTDANNIWASGENGTLLKWNGSSWTAQNPGTGKPLWGIWGTDPNNIWVVGSTGTIVKWNGLSWSAQNSGTSTSFRAIWGYDANNIWAVGVGGGIYKWNGSNWSRQNSGTNNALLGVWGTDANNVWAVGDYGVILKWNGSSWSAQSSGTTQTIYGIWGTDTNNVWAVGGRGTILKWNGSNWSAQSSRTSRSINSVWGYDANNVWAAADRGAILKWNGSSWLSQGSGTRQLLYSVWGADANNVWIVGSGGTALKWDVNGAGCPGPITQSNDAGLCGAAVNYTINTSDNCSGETWQLTTGLASGSTFPVGTTTNSITVTDAASNTASCSFTVTITDDQAPTISCPANITQNNDQNICGAIINYQVTSADNCTGETISQTAGVMSGSTFPEGTTTNSFTVTDAAGNTASCSFTVTIADNEAPTINRWSEQKGGYRRSIWDIWAADVNHVWAVGDVGKIFKWNGSSWADQNTGTNKAFYSVWGTDANNVWAVGRLGTIMKWNGSAWLAQNSGTSIDLWGVWGTDANNIWVVGKSGIILKWDGSSWSTQTSGTNKWLWDVWGTDANNIWAVGDDGTIVKWDGSSWSSQTSGTNSTLFGVWAADANNVWAVGYDGLILKWNGSSWTTEIAGTYTHRHVRSIWGLDANNVWAVSHFGYVQKWNGNHWSIQDTDARSSLYGVGAADANHVWVVGAFDTILKMEMGCPENITKSNDAGICGAVVDYIINTSDNCSGESWQLTAGLSSSSTFPVGTTTNVITVTDASNNTASCSFTVTVTDDEAPQISIVGDNPLVLCEGDSYVEQGATATDNCDPNVNQQIQVNSSAVNSQQEGNYNVTYTVTDVNGNSAQAIRQVIVKHTPAQLAPQNCGSCAQIRFDFCEGESAPDLETLLTANLNYESGADFLWYTDNSGSQGGVISTPVPNMANNNTRFYWVSQSLNGCEGEARRVRVRVRKTSLVQLDLPSLGCGAATIDLAAWVSDSRGIATGFTFYDSDPDAGSPVSVGSVTASSGQVNSGQYAVVSLPASQVTYYAVASNHTGCQVTGSDEVSVGAGPDLAPVNNQTVNAGDLVSVGFSSTTATYIIWYNLNAAPIGLLGNFGMGNILFTASNATTSPITAYMRAIAYSGNCAGEVRDFTITVNPGSNSRQGKQNSIQLTADKVNAHDVQLNWQIQYEFALTGIEIEKQINDGEWMPLDQRNGNQPGVGTHNYVSLPNGTHLDRSGMGNVTKYRLKLIHADGRVIWSQEVEVNFDYFDNKRFTLYPNPTDGRFSLRAAGPLEGEWRYKLSDQLGRTILIGKLQSSETAFDISHQPSGHYHLVITSPEGKSYLRKIAKQ